MLNGTARCPSRDPRSPPRKSLRTLSSPFNFFRFQIWNRIRNFFQKNLFFPKKNLFPFMFPLFRGEDPLHPFHILNPSQILFQTHPCPRGTSQILHISVFTRFFSLDLEFQISTLLIYRFHFVWFHSPWYFDFEPRHFKFQIHYPSNFILTSHLTNIFHLYFKIVNQLENGKYNLISV